MSHDDVKLDFQRGARIGQDEAVFAAGKSPEQLAVAIDHALARGAGLFFTRLSADQVAKLSDDHRARLDYHALSRTAFLGEPPPLSGEAKVAIVAAGTSDAGVVYEAARTLRWHGEASEVIVDVGVAGLHRLLDRVDAIRKCPIAIVVAGMDAALPTVIGGLVPCALIGVPTSVGYGVAEGGHTALHSMLSSCAQGLVVTNIDNGFGAASAALRILRSFAARP